MAMARKCDICGAFYDRPTNVRDIDKILIQYYNGDPRDTIHLDLCSSCFDKVKDVLGLKLNYRYKKGK